jgi:hypothetical protein
LTFCSLEIEYLGYVLTKDGIKPQSNKVQAILAIHPPKGVKQLRHFLGMVQYYLDLWARRSDMLAPLTYSGLPSAFLTSSPTTSPHTYLPTYIYWDSRQHTSTWDCPSFHPFVWQDWLLLTPFLTSLMSELSCRLSYKSTKREKEDIQVY